MHVLLFYGFVSYILHYGYSWINYSANVRNVAAPDAWSVKYYYEEMHNCNDDSREEMLHSTTVQYLHTTFLMFTGLVVS